MLLKEINSLEKQLEKETLSLLNNDDTQIEEILDKKESLTEKEQIQIDLEINSMHMLSKEVFIDSKYFVLKEKSQ